MPNYSRKSKKILSTCDPRIVKVFNEVIKVVDCSVISGARGEEEQNELFREGKSKARFPASYHNYSPSRAIDVVPYPIDWDDRERMTLFAGYVLGVADSMGIKLVWGGDWNRNFLVGDNKFDDFAHFQLEE